MYSSKEGKKMKLKQAFVLLTLLFVASCSNPESSSKEEPSLETTSNADSVGTKEIRIYQVYPRTVNGEHMDKRFDHSFFVQEGKKIFKSDIYAYVFPYVGIDGSGPTYKTSDIYLNEACTEGMYGNMVVTSDLDLFYYCTGTGIYENMF